MKKISLYFILVLSGLPTTCTTWAYTPEECIACHREGSPDSVLHMSVKEFEASVHGPELICEDCHGGVTGEDHETTRGSGAVDCNECHEEENRHGEQASVSDRPQCHSCHPKHRMREKGDRASAVHPDRLEKTCKECHPVESGETDYLSWLPSIRIQSHKKRDFSRAYEKGNCLGCHQGQAAHGEKGPLDEQNCHRCHMPVPGRGPVMGYTHARADSGKQPVIFAAAAVYQILILVLLWGGFRFCLHRSSGKRSARRK